MKRKLNQLLYAVLTAFSLFVILFSCKKDTDVNTDTFEIVKEYEKITVGTTTATITGTFDYSGKVDSLKVRVGKSEQLFGSDVYVAEVSGKAYSVNITGLSSGTRYFYRYEVDYGAKEDFLTETDEFTTLGEAPKIKTLEVMALDSTTVRVKCEVVSDGGSEVTERGICWNTYGDPTLDDETMQHASGGLGQYTIRMRNLALGKKYYVRAYAKNDANKLGYSEEVLDFVTEAPAGHPVEIELSCDPEQGGTVSGGGTYEVGTQCTVTATANTGYTFVNWTENGNQVSSEASYTFAVTTGRSLVAHFTKQAYVITTEVDPEDSGTVTGAGGYDYGEQCTLTAAPKTGYDFQKWTKGSATVSTEAEYNFTVNASATYVAHFKVKSYTVTVSAHPSNGGTVSGGGTVNYGQSCTVHAVPAEGYAFANWTDEGDEVSTDADYTFTVTGNRNLEANFVELQPDEYNIQVSASPTEGGSVSGGGTYQEGQSCKVKATANAGHTFVNWTENGNQVSDLAEYTFTVTSSHVLVAHFEAQAPTEYTVTVSASPSDGGSVTGGGTYEQGGQCTVTATPATGYTFVRWTENGTQVSTNASYTFIVNDNRNLVAQFQAQSYTISASATPSNGGTVSGTGTYNHGQSCTLSATAASGYTFSKWTENGTQVSTNANYTFTVTSSRTLVAHFTVQAPNTYNINVSANPSAGGTVSGGGTYNQGASCTVTANANTGYTFQRWTENGNQVSTSTNYTFTVNGNRTLVAQFQVQSYTISASVNPTNGGTVTGGGSYNHGASCTLTATPATGYTFVKWTKNGTQVSTNASYTFTVTSAASYVAHFQIQSYTIGASANPSNGGSVSGGGTYNYGASCTLTANAASGYTFVRWTENGTQVSTNASYTFTVNSNRTLVAQFQAQSYTISASANPTNGGTVTGGGTYNHGASCTLTATPATGYTFLKWTENGTQVSTNASYTFTVTSNRTLVAQFQAQSYTISASANPTNGGSVSGGGTYNHGASCTLTATPATGSTFLKWTENGTQVSTSASYTFTVTSNRTLVANFTAQSYMISVSANPTNGGTVTGGGSYNYGQSCTLQAAAASGYTFANWTEGDNVVSSSANYTFSVTGSRTLVANFTAQPQAPTGAINGLFTINANGDQVYFSQGNLQYQASTNTWRFATNQWDCIGGTDYFSGIFYGNVSGSSNNNISSTYSGWIDLFGWGTSGYNHGAVCYQPWSTNTTDSDYYVYGQYTYNLYDQTGQADWGYNAISNGGNTLNTWRTLTSSEWGYVFQGRSNASLKYGHGSVNGQNGMILLPDNWTLPSGLSFTPGNSSWSNSYNTQQWSQMEANGAVFLPAAGSRDGTSIMYVNTHSRYWSASYADNHNAYAMNFFSESLYPQNPNTWRYLGFSVRLVRSAQ